MYITLHTIFTSLSSPGPTKGDCRAFKMFYVGLKEVLANSQKGHLIKKRIKNKEMYQECFVQERYQECFVQTTRHFLLVTHYLSESKG